MDKKEEPPPEGPEIRIMSKKWRPFVENIFNKHIIREFDLK